MKKHEFVRSSLTPYSMAEIHRCLACGHEVIVSVTNPYMGLNAIQIHLQKNKEVTRGRLV